MLRKRVKERDKEICRLKEENEFLEEASVFFAASCRKDAIKDNLIPPDLTPAQVPYTYANETDMLNAVLFGRTAKQWKDENPTVKGNMRDVATLNQLLVLANLESYNAVLINQGKNQKERMELLWQLAVQQLQTLETVSLNNLQNSMFFTVEDKRK